MNCFECGEHARYRHHVVPKSLGGKKTIPLCDKCHAAAHGEHGYWTVGDLVSETKQRQIAEGIFTGGAVPYGYQVKGAKLVKDQEQQRFIAWMRRCKQRGLSYTAIAAILNAMQVARAGEVGWYKNVVIRVIEGDRMGSYLKGPFGGGAN